MPYNPTDLYNDCGNSAIRMSDEELYNSIDEEAYIRSHLPNKPLRTVCGILADWAEINPHANTFDVAVEFVRCCPPLDDTGLWHIRETQDGTWQVWIDNNPVFVAFVDYGTGSVEPYFPFPGDKMLA